MTFSKKYGIIIIENEKEGCFMKIQVTYFCATNKFKPVSAIVEVPSSYDFYKRKQYWISRARAQIMAKRHWTNEDMQKFDYTKVKTRIIA